MMFKLSAFSVDTARQSMSSLTDDVIHRLEFYLLLVSLSCVSILRRRIDIAIMSVRLSVAQCLLSLLER